MGRIEWGLVRLGGREYREGRENLRDVRQENAATVFGRWEAEAERAQFRLRGKTKRAL